MAVHKSKEFPGIGFDFDAVADPFFKAGVKEYLRKLDGLATGRALLKAIAKGKPASRGGFPNGVNVVIQRPLSDQFSAPGLGGSAKTGIKVTDQGKYDDWYYGRAGMLMPSMNAKVACAGTNEAAGIGAMTANGKVGTGCTCWLYWRNNEMLSKAGTWLPPHITMGHELIHAWHYMSGAAEGDNRREEHMTVGIKGFDAMPITENKLRAEDKIPLRTTYFADD